MSLEDSLADARRTLPNIPDQVWELWLNDRIRSNGWPPSGPEWQGFLFGRTLSYWARLQWRREVFRLKRQALGPCSINIQREMFAAHILGYKNTLTAYVTDTKARFDGLVAHIERHESLPKPLVLLQTENGFEVIDGNHRVSAMLALGSQQGMPSFPAEVDAWIGRPGAWESEPHSSRLE